MQHVWTFLEKLMLLLSNIMCVLILLSENNKASLPSPPREYNFVEVVVTSGKEAFLHDVRLNAHYVALSLNIHLYTVQQVFDGWGSLPGSKCYHRLLICLKAVNGILKNTQILFCLQHTDHDGRLASSNGLSSSDTNQHLKLWTTTVFINRQL